MDAKTKEYLDRILTILWRLNDRVLALERIENYATEDRIQKAERKFERKASETSQAIEDLQREIEAITELWTHK